MAPPNTSSCSAAEAAAVQDYRASIWTPFQTLYEDKWNQSKWNTALSEFKRRHDPGVLEGLRAKKQLPPWDLLEQQLRKGPPPFMRPGWTSPLQGQAVDLAWLDADAPFVRIRGTKDDWRSAKLLIVEFWATWCRPCHRVFQHLSEIAASERAVKVVTFADEGIFNNAPTDVAALKSFVFARTDMNYPIFVDAHRVAYNALFKPGQNMSIPLVFMISVQDRTVRWVGNAEEMAGPLANALASLR